MSLDQPSRRAFLAGSVVAVGGGGAYYLTRSEDDHTVSPSMHASEETTAFGVDLTDKPIAGSADAPVTIYYWTDFQCPICEQVERETFPDLVREQVDPGRVRIVFVTLPFFGPDSMTSAVASRCVWGQVRDSEPDAYWDWHAAVFDEQDDRNTGWAGTENLLEITASVDGVDAEALETCLDERRDDLEADVDADADLARSLEVRGTPTFDVVNRETDATGRLVGAQPPERFADAIERIEDA